jgi:hypothetical protein
MIGLKRSTGTRKMKNKDKFEEFLETALSRAARATPADEAAAARVLERLGGPLPRQRVPFWRLPAVLLDWQFAPAWPRMAALAGCLALGFAIGIAGLDRPIDRFDDASISGNDLDSAVLAPEPLTGARP